jgi:hypothetical protein
MANWIARANAKFTKTGHTPAAETAKTPLSSVSAACPQRVSDESQIGFGGFGSMPQAHLAENDDFGELPFTPYCCPVSPELVSELHELIGDYATRFQLSEAATQRIIDAAKRQPASTIAASVAFFQSEQDQRPPAHDPDDERVLCLNCAHLSGKADARRCSQWRTLGYRTTSIPADLATTPQRCAGFKS